MFCCWGVAALFLLPLCFAGKKPNMPGNEAAAAEDISTGAIEAGDEMGTRAGFWATDS